MLLYIAPHYGSCSVDGSWPLPTVHSQKSAEAPTIESASKRPKTKGRQTQATHPAHTNPHTANANIRTALFRFLFMKWKTSCTLSDRSRGSWAANRYHIIQRNDISYSMMYYTILYYTILYCTIILYYVIRGNAKRAASFCAANSQDTEPTANACRRNTSLVFVSLFGGKHKQTTREVQSTNRRHKQTTGTLASLSRGLIANTGKRSSTKRSFTARVGEEQDPSGEEDAWEDKPSQHRIGGRRAIVFHWVAGQRLACFFFAWPRPLSRRARQQQVFAACFGICGFSTSRPGVERVLQRIFVTSWAENSFCCRTWRFAQQQRFSRQTPVRPVPHKYRCLWKNTPLEKKILGKTGFESTKSGAGEQLFPSCYTATAREKTSFVHRRIANSKLGIARRGSQIPHSTRPFPRSSLRELAFVTPFKLSLELLHPPYRTRLPLSGRDSGSWPRDGFEPVELISLDMICWCSTQV